MSGFKTILIDCQQCGRKIMVRAVDREQGSITCSHAGCGVANTLTMAFHYDENIVRGLPNFGHLTYQGGSEGEYPLQFGENVIGTADSCAVPVERFIHNGQCFVSRRHCTLTVAFDKWTGQLRYQLQDGAPEPNTGVMRYSLNGTLLNGSALSRTELIDVNDGGQITLGGVDHFRLTHYHIPLLMLDTYKISLAFNPDRTE